MSKVFLSVLFLFALAGCSTDGKLIKVSTPNNCGNTGLTYTPIRYGDSHLVVLNITDIAPGSEWFFRLLPQRRPSTDPVNYENVKVTITPKPASGLTWPDVSGEYSTSRTLRICVPDNVPVGTRVSYDVEVEQVGKLDPRAVVIER